MDRDSNVAAGQLLDSKMKSFGLPRCTVAFSPDLPSALTVEIDSYSAPIRFFEDAQSSLYVVGHPIVGEEISAKQVWDSSSREGLPRELLAQVNGEFLLVHLDKTSETLRVTTDRFSSIPFYYVPEKSGLFGSVFYKEIWTRLKQSSDLQLNPSKFFEFLWLQGVMGSKSYDTRSSLLPAATTLTLATGTGSGAGISLERYWKPSFDKTGKGLDVTSAELADLMRQSMRRKTSDNPGHPGLFLSGGTDSWTVLGAMELAPDCFTVGVTENNEVQVARQAAEIEGAEHHFIPLEADPYSRHIDEMTLIGGGMHAFDHGIYFGLNVHFSNRPDVLFHGQFLDFWFQGTGMLTSNRKIFGRRTSFKQVENFSDDLTRDYLSRISYRLKGISLLDYVVPSRREEMWSSLRGSVDEVRQQGSVFCESDYDEWEHLQFYNFSRRYSASNLTCIGTATEQRTPAFDNDLFDFYLSLPRSHRLNARIAMRALKLLNPQLAALPTANTNERPSRGPLGRDIDRAVRFARRRFGMGSSGWKQIAPEDRTFPDRGRMFAQHPGLRDIALALGDSEALASLGFLDMDLIAKQVPEWLDHPDKDAGAFMTFLVTIDRFLKINA